MHPTGLYIRQAHQMGYAPMIKVLTNETLMDQSAHAQPAQLEPQAQLVIHVVYPQLHLHQLHHHHRVSGEGLEVLLVAQNQVNPCVVSPKTGVGQKKSFNISNILVIEFYMCMVININNIPITM